MPTLPPLHYFSHYICCCVVYLVPVILCNFFGVVVVPITGVASSNNTAVGILPLNTFLADCSRYAQFLALIHTSASIWRYSGGLSKDRFVEEVSRCGEHVKECAWIKVYNNRVYIVRHMDSREPRIRHALLMLHKAVAALAGRGIDAPNVEFGLLAGDNNKPTAPPGPVWWSWGLLPENANTTFLFPDPAYVDWNYIMGSGNDWQSKRDMLHDVGLRLPLHDRIPKFVFRGVNSSSFTSRMDIGDVMPFDWAGGYPVPDWAHNRSAGYLAPEDNCRYKYILYAEGWGFSFRLKYLFMCGSIVLSHDVRFKDLLLTALVPDEDIYYVGPNWERLEEVYRQLEDQDQVLLGMRARAVTEKVFDFTSDHGLACYISELLWQYKVNVQTWEVQPPNPAVEISLDRAFKLASMGRDHERCYDTQLSCTQM